MQKDFYFWFSVFSAILNVILLMAGVWFFVDNRKEKERRSSQVKIWMEQANGLSQALNRIIWDKWNNLYSSIHDVVNAVNAVQASAFSLYQSLYEERVLTEEEYKARQRKLWEKLEKEQERQERQARKKETEQPRLMEESKQP